MPDPDQFEDLKTSMDRIIFFSDAVFAIAITLLALEIRLPADTTTANLLDKLAALQPQFVSFVISFAVVGMYWMVHHRMFRYIKRYDGLLMGLNLLLLLSIVLLPFPSSLLGVLGTSTTSVALYSGYMTIVGLFTVAVFVYAYRIGKLGDALPPRYTLLGLLRVAIPPAVFLLATGLAFLNPLLAEVSWLLIPITRLVVSRIYHNQP